MTRDDTRLTLVFDTPPANEEQASERIQLMFEDPERVEVIRRAAAAAPETEEEASARIRAAGVHPSNLSGSRWRDVEQLTKHLKEHGWVVETKLLKKYGEGYPRAYDVVIKSPNHGVVFLVTADTESGSTRVACANVAHSTNEEWKKEVNG